MMGRWDSTLVETTLLLESRGIRTEMEFNGNILDLKVENAQPQKIITDQEILINKILQDNAMNSIGHLYKFGI